MHITWLLLQLLCVPLAHTCSTEELKLWKANKQTKTQERDQTTRVSGKTHAAWL